MSDLIRAQAEFTLFVSRLIAWHAVEFPPATSGRLLCGRELWRPSYTAKLMERLGLGIRNSLHTDSLAIDFVLYVAQGTKNGRPVFVPQVTTRAYEKLGQFWESMDSRLAWGGRFRKPDAGHFSLAWGGRK